MTSSPPTTWGAVPPPVPGQPIAQWQATSYGQQQQTQQQQQQQQYSTQSPPPVSYTPGSGGFQPPPVQGTYQQQQAQYVPHLTGPHATGKPAPLPPQQQALSQTYGGFAGTATAPTAGTGWGGDTQQPLQHQQSFTPVSSVGTGFSNVGGESGSTTGYVHQPHIIL